jgi:signal transduction histidine kinase/DNA-binding LytR/AlgR family response regulator
MSDRFREVPQVAFVALVLGVAVFFSAWFGILLTREAGRVASIWVANAVVLFALLQMPRRDWGILLGVGYVANLAADLSSGDTLALGAALSLCNTIEVVLAAAMIRRLVPERIDLTRLRDLVVVVVAAVVLAPAVTSLAAAAYLHLAVDARFPEVLAKWFAADALGMLIFTPMLLSLRPGVADTLATGASRSEISLLLALACGTAAVVFWQRDFPFLFLVYLPLTLIAFRLGFAWVAVATLIVAATAIGFTIKGFGPLALIDGEMDTRILVLQLFLACAILLNLPIAAHLAERSRLEEELRAAKQTAEKAGLAKSEFMATMSHELRTPLSSISGFAQILLARPDVDRDMRRQIMLIEQASESLTAIVDDILEFSKFEAGRMAFSNEPFALRALVDNTLSIIREAADRKNLRLRTRYGDRMPEFVRGDQARIRQVVLNLLNNAVKFTHRGSVDIAVDMHPSGNTRIAVKDTGIGIAAEKQDLLFQRFSQLDSSIAREFGGSGLGLAICRNIVEGMGGTISVESVMGKGSTFIVLLPLTAVPREQMVHSEPTDVEITQGTRLLLVEDLEINQEVACATLESAGYLVDVASSGEEALEKISRNSYDLVLMDIQMPGMDGIATTAAIRAKKGAAARIPIVALSANVLPSEIARFRASGMADHVGKPFRQAQLVQAIERNLGSPKTARLEPVDLRWDLDANPTLAGFMKVMGPRRVEELLLKLHTKLEHAFETTPTSLASEISVAREAHAIVSQAGMLGFSDLSLAARRLEEASAASRPTSPAVAEARYQRDIALKALSAMLSQVNRKLAAS